MQKEKQMEDQEFDELLRKLEDPEELQKALKKLVKLVVTEKKKGAKK